MVHELERVMPVCGGFLCSMSATYDGAGYTGFWLHRLTVQIPTSVWCVLEQDTLSALLQSTQL